MDKKYYYEFLRKKIKDPPVTISPMKVPPVKTPPVTISPMKVPPVKTPHNCEAILRNADPPISVSSVVNISEKLRSGVYLKPKKQIKYWVDDRNRNCFMLFPRNLSITWSDHPNYWTWFTDCESPIGTEYVKLKQVNWWLDIRGQFDTSYLTPGIAYEVVFIVGNMKQYGYGHTQGPTPTVNLELVLPNGKEKPQERKLSLGELPIYKTVDVRVGEFVPDESAAGEITFSMYEHDTHSCKEELILKGVAIRPKQEE